MGRITGYFSKSAKYSSLLELLVMCLIQRQNQCVSAYLWFSVKISSNWEIARVFLYHQKTDDIHRRGHLWKTNKPINFSLFLTSPSNSTELQIIYIYGCNISTFLFKVKTL